ncbi:MAG TPA: flagellar export chaperone FliS [Desulfobulbus sp.]|nr:flagellar export chaperone FliS [Desulfobulbus sp.]
MNGYTNQYLANQIASASPEQLLLMFYDGAIRFTSLAMKAIEDNDIPKRTYYINKASAIVAELDATLDRSQDARLAENLDALYAYMLKEYMNANRDNDLKPLKVIVKMLKELRETWAEAAVIYRREQDGPAMEQPAATPAAPKKIAAAM